MLALSTYLRHAKVTDTYWYLSAVPELPTGSGFRIEWGSDEPLSGRGAQGTGVYPVLDHLGITGRTTPPLRLFVSRSVSEASPVSSARELMRAAGVDLGHEMCLRVT